MNKYYIQVRPLVINSDINIKNKTVNIKWIWKYEAVSLH